MSATAARFSMPVFHRPLSFPNINITISGFKNSIALLPSKIRPSSEDENFFPALPASYGTGGVAKMPQNYTDNISPQQPLLSSLLPYSCTLCSGRREKHCLPCPIFLTGTRIRISGSSGGPAYARLQICISDNYCNSKRTFLFWSVSPRYLRHPQGT